jgi:hypothetical protein
MCVFCVIKRGRRRCRAQDFGPGYSIFMVIVVKGQTSKADIMHHHQKVYI